VRASNAYRESPSWSLAHAAPPFNAVLPGGDTAEPGSLVDAFTPISLADLDAAALLDRIDTKFVLSTASLPSLFQALVPEYRVLEINGVRHHRYSTRYFDTPSYQLFHDHLEDRDLRHKVRSRTYLDSGLSFLEVKSKYANGRVVKSRHRTNEPLTQFSEAARDFVAAQGLLDCPWFQPAVDNQFLRITLMHRDETERLTVDLGIRFDSEQRTIVLPGVSVVELKQGEFNASSPFLQHMHADSIAPTRMSKYCVGLALLQPWLSRSGIECTFQRIESVSCEPAWMEAFPLMQSGFAEGRTFAASY